MSNPAAVLQASPVTLPQLQQRIEAAIAPQEWGVELSWQGHRLEVALQGSICPDPLLSLVLIEEILTAAAIPGITAVQLLGSELGQARLGWMGLVELGPGQGKGLAQEPWRSEREAWEASAQDCRLEQQLWLGGSSRADAGGQVEELEPTTQGAAPQTSAMPSASALALTNGFDTYRAFIANQSSWFPEVVKANPELHGLAKAHQHYALRILSHYLVDQLQPGELLGDVLPVQMGSLWGRSRNHRGGALIITDQRAIALCQCSQGNRLALEAWIVPWDWVYKVEIAPRALRLHYGKSKATFQADLSQPERLLKAIPRDVLRRRLNALPGHGRPHLATVPGFALVGSIMFAIGSAFSGLSREPLPWQKDAVSDQVRSSLSHSANVLGRRPVPPGSTIQPNDSAAPAIPLTPTTTTGDPAQCLESFNEVAQSHAYATLNPITQTLQIRLENNRLKTLSQSQFNQAATAIAQEVLTSCQAPAISQVQISNGVYRYRQARSALPLPASPGARLE